MSDYEITIWFKDNMDGETPVPVRDVCRRLVGHTTELRVDDDGRLIVEVRIHDKQFAEEILKRANELLHVTIEDAVEDG